MSHNDYSPELQAALQRLYARQTFGIKLGLEPTKRLLAAIGSPERELTCIHVAGTNGKGSVCSMLASILAQRFDRVGLYTSPHLVQFGERVRINGQPMPEEDLAAYAFDLLPVIEREECTFFEGTTALALKYFHDQHVDVAILETGMGGRLDSTNVVTPAVSVITSIGFDHQRHLGGTLEEIAIEKAGIMKPDVPVVVGSVRPRLRSVFEKHARHVGSPIAFADDDCRSIHRSTSLDGTTASFMIAGQECADVFIDLPGRHQIENARVAIETLRIFLGEESVPETELRAGLASVRTGAGLMCRFEKVHERPNIILDVSHNLDGVETLVDILRESLGDRPVRFVYGAVKDKDVQGIVRAVAPYARKLYAVNAANPRSLPSDEIAHWSKESGVDTEDCGDVWAGLSRAIEESHPDDTIVLFGSFFVAGEGLTVVRDMSRKEGSGERSAVRYQSGTPAKSTVAERMEPVGDVADEIEALIETGPLRAAKAALESAGGDGSKEQSTVADWHPHDQPRERLMELGPSALSDAELLAILIRTGTRSKDVVSLSRELIARFGDGMTGDRLIDLAGRDLAELQKLPGIGPTKAVTLAAAFELGNRVVARSFQERPIISGPEDVARMFIPRMRALRKEQFHVVILNTAGQVVRTELVSEGSLNTSVVYPREVFRTAIVENGASVIGLHNHPSGNPKPSPEDIKITRQLVGAGQILNIAFHDHIIIAGEEYVSLKEQQLM